MEMFSVCEVMSKHAACDVDKARAISCIISYVFRVLNPFSSYLSLTSLVVRWKSFIHMSIYRYLLRDVEVTFVMWGFSFVQISASCFLVSIRLSRNVKYSREIPGSRIHFCHSTDGLQSEYNTTVDISYSHRVKDFCIWNFEFVVFCGVSSCSWKGGTDVSE